MGAKFKVRFDLSMKLKHLAIDKQNFKLKITCDDKKRKIYNVYYITVLSFENLSKYSDLNDNSVKKV